MLQQGIDFLQWKPNSKKDIITLTYLISSTVTSAIWFSFCLHKIWEFNKIEIQEIRIEDQGVVYRNSHQVFSVVLGWYQCSFLIHSVGTCLKFSKF